jgi:hypothetical protein
MKFLLFDSGDFWSIILNDGKEEIKQRHLLRELRRKENTPYPYMQDHLFRGIPTIPEDHVGEKSSLSKIVAGDITVDSQDGFDFKYWHDFEKLPKWRKPHGHAPNDAGEVERVVNLVGRLSWETYGVCNAELDPLTDMERAIVDEIGILSRTDDADEIYGKKLRANEDLAEAYLNERADIDFYLAEIETPPFSNGKPDIGHSVFGVRPEENILLDPTSKKLIVPPGIDGTEPLDSFYMYLSGKEREDDIGINGYTCNRLKKIGNVTVRRSVFDRNLWNVMQDRGFRYGSPPFLYSTDVSRIMDA